MPLVAFLHRICERENLNALDARLAMGSILSGEATPVEIAAFLTALRMKGVTPEELVGFARAMRRVAEPVEPHLNGEALLDTCGTGGDGSSTFNISTLVALVVAGAGVHVAKHGNRSISSHCGSADLMEALGVNILLTPDQVARSIEQVGIGFLFAPSIHRAMKYAQPVRLELKMRTVFNLLGPLTNPAGATVQLAGAPSEETAGMMARALSTLGLERGYVVHGSDGLDEVTTTGRTYAFEITPSGCVRHVLRPEDFGVERAEPRHLRASNLEANVAIAREVLSGKPGPRTDIVLVNAALALQAAGVVYSLPEGVQRAAETVDSGRATAKLEALVAHSRAQRP